MFSCRNTLFTARERGEDLGKLERERERTEREGPNIEMSGKVSQSVVAEEMMDTDHMPLTVYYYSNHRNRLGKTNTNSNLKPG